MDVFISHSWEDKDFVYRLEKGIEDIKLSAWVDHANLRAGGLLINELQDALVKCDNLALVWSKHAAESRYVQTEWQVAFHFEKSIIPCRLDDTSLPPFLTRIIYCDFRKDYEHGFSELSRALGGSRSATTRGASGKPVKSRNLSRSKSDPDQDTKGTAVVNKSSKPYRQTVAMLWQGQSDLLDLLSGRRLAEAAQKQKQLDAPLEHALKAYFNDDQILSMAGYHKKNAYMIKYWNEIQALTFPDDPLLAESEKLFQAALSIKPDDPAALNGVGNVLLFRHDLDAAEFYIIQALAKSKAQQLPFEGAEHDLRLVRRIKKEEGRA